MNLEEKKYGFGINYMMIGIILACLLLIGGFFMSRKND